MPETRSTGPGGYAEVRATPGTPHPDAGPAQAPPAAVPFTPPDTSGLGYGAAAGGATQNHGGSLADKISGTGEESGGPLASLGGEAEGGEAALAVAAL